MDVDLIFKIAAVGILVAVLNQLLVRSGREEQAMMTTLAGLVVVMMMLVRQISDLFQLVKSCLLYTSGEVVGVQVHHADEAVTDAAIGLLALDIHQGLGQHLEHAAGQVLIHGGVDVGDVLVHIGGLQVGLRQDQTQGRCV